jgi:hypothetical protein
MWEGLETLGGVVSRAGLSAALLSSLAVLAMLACRQPARRVALARATLLGLLLLIPLMGLAPLPRSDLAALLRDAGLWPHPLRELMPAAPGGWGRLPVRGPWPARGLLVLYLAGVGGGLCGVVLGCWGMRWLTRHSHAPAPETQALYDAVAAGFSGRRPRGRSGYRPRLLVSPHSRGPMLVGFLRPTILLPASLDAAPGRDGGEAEALRLGLLHELAHAERRDAWFHLVASLAQAVWFFLPPVWWIRTRMCLDHEFLADRRAARGFDTPAAYASSLLGMAASSFDLEPDPDRDSGRSEGLSRGSGPVAAEEEAGSPFLQRVRMLVQCPFLLETRPPTWWRWSLPLVGLLITPAAAWVCLGLQPAPAPSGAAPAVAPPRTFDIPRLALDPQKRGPHGRAAVSELPLRLPSAFELSVEVWGDPATLAHCRVAGLPLTPCVDVAAVEGESWHRVRLRRNFGELALSVDGRAASVGPDVAQITRCLSVEPAPDRPALFRNLHVTW